MSLVLPSNNNNQIVRAAAGTALTAAGVNAISESIRVLSTLYSQLPNLKQGAAKDRSSFERKMAGPKNNKRNGGITSGATAQKAIVDVSRAGSSNTSQRSSTGSRMVSNPQRNKIPRSPYTEKLTICFRGEIPVINFGVNYASFALPLGIDTGSSSLATYMTQLTAMAGIFQEFRCNKLAIDFVPQVGSTVNGVIAVAIDRDPRAVGVSSTAPLVRRTPFFEVDIKQPGGLVWTPVDTEDRRWRYTHGLAGARAVEFLSHGQILAYSNNDQAAGVQVGRIFVDGVFEFQVPA